MEVRRSNGNASPSSSPPTPPSPLPISYGPGQSNYLFSASPSPSPPFSPPSTSPHASSQTLPLLHKDAHLPPSSSVFSPFSLDHRLRPDEEADSSHPSCLRELLEWLVQRCCNCCTNNSKTDSATEQLPKDWNDPWQDFTHESLLPQEKRMTGRDKGLYVPTSGLGT